MRCPTMSYGLQVSGPSLATIHSAGMPANIVRTVHGVRCRTAIPLERSKSMVSPTCRGGKTPNLSFSSKNHYVSTPSFFGAHELAEQQLATIHSRELVHERVSSI